MQLNQGLLTGLPYTEVKGLGLKSFHDFNDLMDFIWKSPDLINYHKELENKKLEAYFPLTGDKEEDLEAKKFRLARSFLEQPKLTKTFPALMVAGNLSSSTSLFEAYCLTLCKQIEKAPDLLKNVNGNGIKRLFKFLSQYECDPAKIALYSQIDAIFKIRNCIFHANGSLSLSRDERELRRIVSCLLFLPESVRAKRKETPLYEPDLTIVSGPLGDQLKISNYFTWFTACILRDFFCTLYHQSSLKI